MQPEIRKTAEKFKKQGTKRRLWQRIVSGLTCIVVFCTTYALILPAITMEGDAFCGKTEHIHDPSCYNGVGVIHCDPVHYHSSGCYGEEGDLVCGQNEYVLHTHDSLCYGTDGSLICTLPEIAAHVHGDSCYTQVMPEGHRHEDGCYILEQGELICGQEESEGHGHGEGCYGEQVLTCQIPESAGHAHEPGCYSEPSLVCGQEEIEGHAHGEGCYGEDGSLTCQLPEVEAHVHGDGCYTQELICGQEESEGHSHGGTCFETPLVCTLAESEGHTHGDGCYAWNQVLVCQLEEVQPQNLLTCTVANEITHVHTEACRTEPELVCGQEVHTHTLACYSDSGADVETAELWKATMAGANLSGSDAQNLVTIAQTQLGYAESSRNYAVLEDEVTIKGYTRYGAWAGTPYADWSELFVEFCLHYAGISETDFPWRTMAKTHPETPASGDVIFLELENEQYAGIVTKVSDGYVTAILGDYHNEVRSETFSLADPDIKGYASMREEDHQQETEEAVTETTADETSTTTAETTETTVETTVETTEEKVAGLVELEKIEMVYSTLMTLAQGGTTTTQPTDLGAATTVQISAVYGTSTLSSGAIYDPETDSFDVSLRFDFTLTKAAIEKASYLYTYKLPGNIIVPDDLLNTERIGKDGQKDAFIYKFVKYQENGEDRYRVDIHYLDTYVNASGETIESYIEFDGKVSGDSLNNETGNLVVDKDTIIKPDDIVYPPDETHNYSIKTEKSANISSGYNGSTIQYTVVVSSDKGTPDPIHIVDTLTPTGVQIHEIANVSVVKNGQAVSPKNLSILKNGVSMDLDALSAGETYEITYTCNVGQLWGQNHGYVNNQVTASAQTPFGTEIKSSDSTSSEISNNPVNKSGTYNTAEQEIDWTIKVGSKLGFGLIGYVLTDPAFNSMNEAELRAAISPAEGFDISQDSAGNWQIVFTKTETRTDPRYGTYDVNYTDYTIRYSTSAPQTTMPGQQTNTVELEYQNNGYPYTDKETVNIPAAGSINKSFVSAADSVVNWKIEINIPEGGLASGTVIQDNVDDNMSMTYDQFMALKEQLDSILGKNNPPDEINYKLEAREIENNWNYVDFSTDLDKTHTFDEIKITVMKDHAQAEFSDGKITLNLAHKITSSYDGQTYRNYASMGDKNDSDSYTYHPHVTKTDANGNSNSTVTSKDGKLYWQVRVYVENDADEIKVVDTLPAGVTLSKIGYSYEGWRAGQSAKPLDQADATVTIMYKELGVTNQRVDPSENGTETITTTFTAKSGDKILAGSVIYLYYECTMDELVDGSELSFTNNVEVWDNDVYYGSDDDTQKVTVDLPDQIVKVDGGGNTGTTTNVDISSGKLYWYVKLYLQEETNQITVFDQLPKGLTLTRHDLSHHRQNDGKIQLNATTENLGLHGNNYSVTTTVAPETESAGQQITTIITAPEGQSLPVMQEFYLGYECTINEDYVFAEDGKFTFTNTATLNPDDPDHPDPVTQTQEGTKKEETTTTEVAEKLGLASDQWGNKYLDKNEMTYQDDNGIVRWMIKIPVDANVTTIDITDTLPVGVKLVRHGVSNTVESNFKDTIDSGTVEITGTSGTLSYWTDQMASYSISGDGTKTSPYEVKTQVYIPSNWYNYWRGPYVFLYYECQIDPMPALGQTIKYDLTNTAEVKVDGALMNTPSHTQHVTVSNPAARVTKNGVMNGATGLENRFYYNILINEGGENLEDEEGKTLVVNDVMMYEYDANSWDIAKKINSSLVRESVKLYYAVLQEDGTFAKGAALQAHEWSWVFKTNQNDVQNDGQGDVENELTITIPDETPVFLEYAYDISLLLTPEELKQYNGQDIDLGISNTASFADGIEGSDSFDESVKFKVSSASAGASTAKSYTFTKINQDKHSETLPGAVFKVYKAADNSEVNTYVTDNFGSFTISLADKITGTQTSAYVTDTLYYAVETTAPDGYEKPVNPPKYYFYFSSENGTPPTIPDGVTAYDLSKVGHAVDVGNKKLPSGNITVEKKWYNGAGTTEINGYEKVTSISFALYQVSSSTAPVENTGSGNLVATTPTGGTLYQENLVVSKEENWTTTIRDLPSQAYDTNGNLIYYTYYVVENSDADFELMGYVNNAGITDGTITISNKEKSPVYELPETGGAGTFMYTLSGLVLCGTAALGYNHKKRRKEDHSS